MVVESAIFWQRDPSQFSDTAHQISLLAGLHALSNLFLYKTQEQPILQHSSLFPLYFIFQPNWEEVSLTEQCRRILGAF